MNMSKSTFKLIEEEREYLAERMKKARATACMSQGKVSKAVGYSSSILSLFENARVELTYQELEKFAKVLSTDVVSLVSDVILLERIKKYSNITEEKIMTEDVKDVAPEVEVVPEVEEIQISDILLTRMKGNNINNYTTTQILNSLMNWFSLVKADIQKNFVETYATDKSAVRARLDQAISEGNFEDAKVLLELYEKVSQ